MPNIYKGIVCSTKILAWFVIIVTQQLFQFYSLPLSLSLSYFHDRRHQETCRRVWRLWGSRFVLHELALCSQFSTSQRQVFDAEGSKGEEEERHPRSPLSHIYTSLVRIVAGYSAERDSCTRKSEQPRKLLGELGFREKQRNGVR